jgi:DNA-binding HxlR family transcriptional regulator
MCAAAASSTANLFDPRCPSREILQLVGDRWTLLVVAVLERGTQRNADLRREIGGISPKVLATTLRKLEEFGFVNRVVHPEIPPRVEYSLTELGRELATHIVALDRWMESRFADVQAARERFAQRRGAKNAWQDRELVQALPRRTQSRGPEPPRANRRVVAVTR